MSTPEYPTPTSGAGRRRRVWAIAGVAIVLAAGVGLFLARGTQGSHANPPTTQLPCASSRPFAWLIGADAAQIVRSEGVVTHLHTDGSCDLTNCKGTGAPATCPHWVGTWRWDDGAIVARLVSFEERLREHPATGSTLVQKRAIAPPAVVTYRWSEAGGHWTSTTAAADLDWANGLRWACDERR